MALSYSLQLDGIVGDGTNPKGSISVLSFSFGVSSPPPGGSGAGAGKVSISSLSLQTALSQASPRLLLACEQGTIISSGVLTATAGGGEGAGTVAILQLTLGNVHVDSISWSGSGGADVPAESLSLSFQQIHFTVGATGTETGAVTTGWDLATNEAA